MFAVSVTYHPQGGTAILIMDGICQQKDMAGPQFEYLRACSVELEDRRRPLTIFAVKSEACRDFFKTVRPSIHSGGVGTPMQSIPGGNPAL